MANALSNQERALPQAYRLSGGIVEGNEAHTS
jgi:hypothetical protein